MCDTNEPCKWSISINVKTKFDFKNSFSNNTFELRSYLNRKRHQKLKIKIKIKKE